jgi:hypothetical protein
MRVGTLLATPNDYSHYGRIKDETGVAYSVEAGDIPKGAKIGDKFAYKVEIWGGDGGIAYELEK